MAACLACGEHQNRQPIDRLIGSFILASRSKTLRIPEAIHAMGTGGDVIIRTAHGGWWGEPTYECDHRTTQLIISFSRPERGFAGGRSLAVCRWTAPCRRQR